MKNILYIDTGLEYGGGTKSFLYLLEYLDKTQYKPFVFFENNYKVGDKFISEIIKEKGGEFIESSIKKTKHSKIKKEFLRLISKKLLKQKEFEYKLDFARKFLSNLNFKVDIIHLNNHFGTNLEYIIAANELNIKVIQHLRKNSMLDKWKIELLKTQKFNTISISKTTNQFYKNLLDIDKNIIYNPFLIDIKPYKKEKTKNIQILFPANYFKNKGHHIVLEAMQEISNIDLLLAGSGKLDSNSMNIINKHVNIKELGFVDLDEWYRKVDYVMLFSENEGFGRVIVEGLLYGCGIISSNYPAVYEIYENSNQDNFYIINRQKKELHNLLKNLYPLEYKIPDQKIKNIFSLDSYIQKIENLYKSLL